MPSGMQVRLPGTTLARGARPPFQRNCVLHVGGSCPPCNLCNRWLHSGSRSCCDHSRRPPALARIQPLHNQSSDRIQCAHTTLTPTLPVYRIGRLPCPRAPPRLPVWRPWARRCLWATQHSPLGSLLVCRLFPAGSHGPFNSLQPCTETLPLPDDQRGSAAVFYDHNTCVLRRLVGACRLALG